MYRDPLARPIALNTSYSSLCVTPYTIRRRPKLRHTCRRALPSADRALPAHAEETVQQHKRKRQVNSTDGIQETIQQNRRKRQFNIIDGRDNSTG